MEFIELRVSLVHLPLDLIMVLNSDGVMDYGIIILFKFIVYNFNFQGESLHQHSIILLKDEVK